MKDISDAKCEVGPITVKRPDKDGAVDVVIVCTMVMTDAMLEELGFPLPDVTNADVRVIKKIVTTGALGKGATSTADLTFVDAEGHPVELRVDVEALDYVIDRDGVPSLILKGAARAEDVLVDPLARLVEQGAVGFDLAWAQRELDLGAQEGRKLHAEAERLVESAGDKRENVVAIMQKLAVLAADPPQARLAVERFNRAIAKDPSNTALTSARDFLVEQLQLASTLDGVDKALERSRAAEARAEDGAPAVSVH